MKTNTKLIELKGEMDKSKFIFRDVNITFRVNDRINGQKCNYYIDELYNTIKWYDLIHIYGTPSPKISKSTFILSVYGTLTKIDQLHHNPIVGFKV